MAYFLPHTNSHQNMFTHGVLAHSLFFLWLPLCVTLLLFPPLTPGITTSFSCPDGCLCDSYNGLVDCSKRGIEVLSTELSYNTRVLMCQDNNFKWISQENFNITNLRRLRKLSLANNLITGVSQDSFAGLLKIVNVDMSRNTLYRIPHDIRLLKSLNQLDLSRNAIQLITPHNFHNESELEVLSLAHNRLHDLDSESFYSLKYLQVLSLRNNSISNIGRRTLHRTVFLEELDLSMNHLGLNDPLANGVNPLNVSDWFTTPDACSQLNKILLSDNMLQGFVWDAFDSLTALRTLDIHSNLITRLHSDVFQNLRSLEVLLASHNRIESLPLQLFKRSHNLQSIELSHNLISYIPTGTFSTNSNLLVIQLSGNQLDNVDWLLHSSSSIMELYLSNNLIADIPESTLQFFPHLQVLELENNFLQKVPSLWNMTKLKRLNLRGNQISFLPPDTRFHFPDLTFLSIAANSLQTLDEEVFWSLPPVLEFQVADNPYLCDCRLLWMDYIYLDYLQNIEIPPNFEPWIADTYESMICDHPNAYQGEPLAQVAMNRHNLGCSAFADVRGVVGLVLGWLLVVCVVVCAYWRWKCRWANKRMRAWKPKRSPRKRRKVTKVSRSAANDQKANGRVKTYDSGQLEYTSQFDRDSHRSLANAGDRVYSPACVCLLQPDDHMHSSDILTETTV